MGCLLLCSLDGKENDAVKKYLKLLLMFCMIMTVLAAAKVSASESDEGTMRADCVYSDTTEISQSDINQIKDRAASISGQYKIDGAEIGVYIAVVDWYGDMAGDVESATYYFYCNAPYKIKDNGILLFFSIGDREYDAYTFGTQGQKIFNDYAVDDVIIESIYDDLHNDRWTDALSHYLDKCDEVLKLAADGTVLTYKSSTEYKFFNWGISAVIALIIMLCVAGVLKSQMKSVTKKVEARNYVKEGSFDISYRNDRYTHSTETRRKIEKSSSSSSGGSGGGSHHSGKF